MTSDRIKRQISLVRWKEASQNWYEKYEKKAKLNEVSEFPHNMFYNVFANAELL